MGNAKKCLKKERLGRKKSIGFNPNYFRGRKSGPGVPNDEDFLLLTTPGWRLTFWWVFWGGRRKFKSSGTSRNLDFKIAEGKREIKTGDSFLVVHERHSKLSPGLPHIETWLITLSKGRQKSSHQRWRNAMWLILFQRWDIPMIRKVSCCHLPENRMRGKLTN